jgi:zinc-ribbon domain
VHVFCQGCGKQIEDSAQFCTVCGRPIEVVRIVPTAIQTLAAHARVLGILWAIYGGFQVLMAFWTVAMSRFYVSIFEDFVSRDPNFPASWVPFLRNILLGSAIFAFVGGAIAISAGWALLRRDASGRVTALVAAFLSLINIPLGTGLGIYTLIELLPVAARDNYVRLTAGPRGIPWREK